MQKALMAVGLAGAIGLAAIAVPRLAWSHDPDDMGASAYGWCWGDGYGGHGPGMGTGMMGYGYGGMMGPGYRAGMWSRDSRGWGPGMMSGFSGLGPIWRLDLSDAQRTKVDKIADDLRRANWATMGRLMEARARLSDVQSASEPDPQKVSAAFANVSKLEQDMVETTVHARNEARATLTPAQQQEFDQWRAQRWSPRDRSPAAARR